MSEKEKMMVLLQNVPANADGIIGVDVIADHILADGWIRPPCKVGQTVYVLVKTVSAEKKESSIVILEGIAAGREERLNDRTRWELEIYISEYPGEKTYVKPISVPEEEFGNTVFLSREEAEKALEDTNK